MLCGDKRQEFAADYLKKENYEIEIFDPKRTSIKNLCDYKAIILPVPSTKDGHFLFSLCEEKKIALYDILSSLSGQLLIAGNYRPEYKNYIDICKREDYKLLNAIPTAEAAICIALQNISKTLWNSKILVVGNGNIGKALCIRLMRFGAQITVSARKTNDFAYLDSLNIKHYNTNDLSDIIGEFDIIFNTVPFPIIKEKEIINCKKDCLLIELSSFPFGIDKEFAINSGLKYVYAPALPGKYFPETAGKILGICIKNILNENDLRSDNFFRSDG